MKNSKMRMLTTEYETFDWKVDDSVKTMTDRLIATVNELRKYGKYYTNEEVHIKMLHALPNLSELRLYLLKKQMIFKPSPQRNL